MSQNKMCDDEIIYIIHALTSPFNDKFDLSFLMEIRRKIRDYKTLDYMPFEGMIEKFDSIECPVSNEMRVLVANGEDLGDRKIHYIKAIRKWFNDSENLYCGLADAKSLVERIIK